MSKVVTFGPAEVQSGANKGDKRYLTFALPKVVVSNPMYKDAEKNDKGQVVAKVANGDILIPSYAVEIEEGNEEQGNAELAANIAEIQKELGEDYNRIVATSIDAAIIAAARAAGNKVAVGAVTGTVESLSEKIRAAMSSVTLKTLTEDRTRGGFGIVKAAKTNASEVSQALAAAGGDVSKLSPEDLQKMLDTIAMLSA